MKSFGVKKICFNSFFPCIGEKADFSPLICSCYNDTLGTQTKSKVVPHSFSGVNKGRFSGTVIFCLGMDIKSWFLLRIVSK